MQVVNESEDFKDREECVRDSSSRGVIESNQRERERERTTWIMFGEEEKRLVPRSRPWVYSTEEEMLNGYNRDAPP